MATISRTASRRSPIAQVLADGGPVGRSLPGYVERPGQIAMAELVYKALQQGEHAVIEAGTGTGKTLAYLIPAIYSNKTVIVSTANKALQEQLIRKDIPFLQKVLPMPVKAAIVKGRGNYLCLDRFRDEEGFQAMTGGSLLAEEGHGERNHRIGAGHQQGEQTAEHREQQKLSEAVATPNVAASTTTGEGDEALKRSAITDRKVPAPPRLFAIGINADVERAVLRFEFLLLPGREIIGDARIRVGVDRDRHALVPRLDHRRYAEHGLVHHLAVVARRSGEIEQRWFAGLLRDRSA